MHISNFRPLKRIPDIIEVFEGVLQRIDTRLILIGSGPELEKIQMLVDEKELTDKVSFLGRQNDVSKLIPCADVYMLPSEYESFGLTALEAMSCCVPVIGTSGSGMDDFLGDKAAGFLYPVGDVNAMVKGCVRILENPELAEEMGKKGRERAIEKYNIDYIVDKYEDLYRKVL